MPQKPPAQTRLEFPEDHPAPGTRAWVIHEIAYPRKNLTRSAHLTNCPQCAALTLSGYDDDVAAGPARADPILLLADHLQILALAGRTIYWLQVTETSYRLHTTAGALPGIRLVPDHRCGYPPPGRPLLAPTTPPDPNQPPPF